MAQNVTALLDLNDYGENFNSQTNELQAFMLKSKRVKHPTSAYIQKMSPPASRQY